MLSKFPYRQLELLPSKEKSELIQHVASSQNFNFEWGDFPSHVLLVPLVRRIRFLFGNPKANFKSPGPQSLPGMVLDGFVIA